MIAILESIPNKIMEVKIMKNLASSAKVEKYLEVIFSFFEKFPILVTCLYILFRTLKYVIFYYSIDIFLVENVSAEQIINLARQLISMLIFSVPISFILFVILVKLRYGILTLFILEFFYIALYVTYYNYFGNYIALTQAKNLFEGIKAFPTLKIIFSPHTLLIPLIDLPIVLLLLSQKVRHGVNESLRKNRLGVIITILLLISIVGLREYSLYKKERSLFHFLTHRIDNYYEDTSLLIRHYGTAFTALIHIPMALNENKMIEKLIKYGPNKKFHKKDKIYNVVLIQVESLDSEVVSIEFNNKPITPFLYSLAKKCYFSPYVVAYHFGAGATTDADFSILNSLEASPEAPLFSLRNYNFPQALPKLFKENGYETIAFHNNEGIYFGRKTSLPLMGFDKFEDRLSMKLEKVWWGAPDGKMFEYIQNKIINQNEPFFYYIITMSSHGPFEHILTHYHYTNEEYDNWKESEGETVANYWNAMSYVDKELEKFVSFIITNQPNTHILIIGDHSANVKGKTYTISGAKFKGRIVELVPMFFIPAKNSHYKKPKEITFALSHLDVAPTLIDASGIEAEIKTYGDSIFSENIENSEIPYLGYWINRKEITKATLWKQ